VKVKYTMSYTVDNNGTNGVLLVSTRQHPGEIIKTGGVLMPSAKVNRNRIETTTKWVICCDEVNNNAFLIGKIDKVLWVGEGENNQCVVKISEYAQINKEDVWTDYGAKKYAWTYLDNPSVCKMRPGKYQFFKIGRVPFGTMAQTFNKPEAKQETARASSIETEVKKSEPVIVEQVKLDAGDLRAIIAKGYGIDRKHVVSAEVVIKFGEQTVTIKG
jgi:hypothetical protein